MISWWQLNQIIETPKSFDLERDYVVAWWWHEDQAEEDEE